MGIDKAEGMKPFTDDEREWRKRRASQVIEMPSATVDQLLWAKDRLRYEATIRREERMRIAAMVFVSRWLDGGEPRFAAEGIRETLARQGYHQMHSAEMAGIAAALEMLPEEIPDIADAIDALYDG